RIILAPGPDASGRGSRPRTLSIQRIAARSVQNAILARARVPAPTRNALRAKGVAHGPHCPSVCRVGTPCAWASPTARLRAGVTGSWRRNGRYDDEEIRAIECPGAPARRAGVR